MLSHSVGFPFCTATGGSPVSSHESETDGSDWGSLDFIVSRSVYQRDSRYNTETLIGSIASIWLCPFGNLADT